MKKLNILFLILFMNISCSGRMLSTNFRPPLMGASGFSNYTSQMDPEIDKEFKTEEFDDETFNDKAGYVIWGIILVAATAASIAIPIILTQ